MTPRVTIMNSVLLTMISPHTSGEQVSRFFRRSSFLKECCAVLKVVSVLEKGNNDIAYSFFEIHICWKVESEDRMEPPIQTEYLCITWNVE